MRRSCKERIYNRLVQRIPSICSVVTGFGRCAQRSVRGSRIYSWLEERKSVPQRSAVLRSGLTMGPMKLVAAIFLASALVVSARDPDILTDFLVPAGVNASSLNGDFFTFTGLRDFAAPAGTFAAKKVSLIEFPALNGLGVGVTLLEYSPGTLNPPHTHPRGTELLYVLAGALEVGVVDSANKLYAASLKKGDLFAFPQGLVHFQINKSKKTARALSAFGSANAGTVSLPRNLFGSGIPDDVLTAAFKLTPEQLAALKAPFTS